MKKRKREWWVYTAKGNLVAYGSLIDHTNTKRIKEFILDHYGYSESQGYKIIIR